MWISGVMKSSDLIIEPTINTTNAIARFVNNGNILYCGVDNSTGGSMGKGAYASYFYSQGNTNMVFGSNGSIHLTLAPTGAATFASTVTASNGQLIGGTGTTNYLPKFTGAGVIGNSQIFDNGTNILVKGVLPFTTSPSGVFHIDANVNAVGNNATLDKYHL